MQWHCWEDPQLHCWGCDTAVKSAAVTASRIQGPLLCGCTTLAFTWRPQQNPDHRLNPSCKEGRGSCLTEDMSGKMENPHVC